MRAVVDASVVVAVLRGSVQPDASWAEDVVARHALTAPELVQIETTSALRRLVGRGELEPASGQLALTDLLSLPVELYPFAPLAARVWGLRESVSAYDACYVALAELLEIPLLTLDRRLSRAPGLRCEVVVPDQT